MKASCYNNFISYSYFPSYFENQLEKPSLIEYKSAKDGKNTFISLKKKNETPHLTMSFSGFTKQSFYLTYSMLRAGLPKEGQFGPIGHIFYYYAWGRGCYWLVGGGHGCC